jgi:uncharacterized membrane protein
MSIRKRPAGEDGTILLLTLGYAILVLALVAVVIDVSAVYLARRALAADCDGAALAAAQSVDADAIYRQGAAPTELPLSRVDTAVAGYPVGDGVRLDGSVGSATEVTVTGRRTLQLPLVRFLGVGTVEVMASATAHTQRAAP